MNVSKTTMVGVILASLIAGVMVSQVLNVIATNDDKANPWEEVWEAIHKLQAQADARAQIITDTAYPTWTELDRGVWTDLLSISNVAVSEDANIIATTSAFFKCMEQAISPLKIRYRVNNTYGEEYYQGFSGIWAAGTACETIEIHHAWTDLDARTYTFAIQYWVYPTRELYVANPRLTLMIFR
jgi:hypothetical protein